MGVGAVWDRRGWLLLVGVVSALLMMSAAAYACTAIATMEFSSSQGVAGADIDGSGKGFKSSHGQSPGGIVQVRFDRRDGEVLWEGPAAEDGSVSFNFTVPDAPAGHYVLVATQSTVDEETGEETGTPVYGTPARQSFEIVAAASQSSSAASADSSAPDAGVAAKSSAPADASTADSREPAGTAAEPSAPAPAAADSSESVGAPAPAAADSRQQVGAAAESSAPAAGTAESSPSAASAAGPSAEAARQQTVNASAAQQTPATTSTKPSGTAVPPSGAGPDGQVSSRQDAQPPSGPTALERFAEVERAAASASEARLPAVPVDMAGSAVRTAEPTSGGGAVDPSVVVAAVALLASLGLVGMAGRRLSHRWGVASA